MQNGAKHIPIVKVAPRKCRKPIFVQASGHTFAFCILEVLGDPSDSFSVADDAVLELDLLADLGGRWLLQWVTKDDKFKFFLVPKLAKVKWTDLNHGMNFQKVDMACSASFKILDE